MIECPKFQAWTLPSLVLFLRAAVYQALQNEEEILEDCSFTDSLLYSFSVINCSFHSIVYSFIL